MIGFANAINTRRENSSLAILLLPCVVSKEFNKTTNFVTKLISIAHWLYTNASSTQSYDMHDYTTNCIILITLVAWNPLQAVTVFVEIQFTNYNVKVFFYS